LVDGLVAPGRVEAEVAERFGMVPNFFRSAAAAPDLIQQLWGFTKAGYLDNPMPSVLKERLFVWLSRFCPTRYCIVRHVGFLLGGVHGRASGDAAAPAQSVTEVVDMLRRPTPWQRDMTLVYQLVDMSSKGAAIWPASGSDAEDALFACAAMIFVEPARSDQARRAVALLLGARDVELFNGFLTFVRTAHYWTMLHPEIETEDDMQQVMRGHEELAQLLWEDPEADRCEMGERLFQELSALREGNERHELERARQALEEKDRQKDEFIAILAHELRNPLSAIRAATDCLALCEGQDPLAGRLVERLDRQTSAMARLLDDLLDASRIALGRVSIQLERVELSSLCESLLEEHRPSALQLGLEIVARGTGTQCIVNADRIRLRQILDNLLSNAIKFTPAGGRIDLGFVEHDDQAVITVQDTGLGFDELFAPKLFEPFTQQYGTRDKAGGGLGLGLAIANRLALLQGGSISATSAGVNQGALFTLTFPLAGRSVDSKSNDAPVSSESRHSILLIEDNIDAASSLADLLELKGCKVSVAHDGVEGFQMALRIVPDVIVCDLALPGACDGFGVARACRDAPVLQSVRLLAMSGYNSARHHSEAHEAGFECLLTKPLNSEAMAMLTQELHTHAVEASSRTGGA